MFPSKAQIAAAALLGLLGGCGSPDQRGSADAAAADADYVAPPTVGEVAVSGAGVVLRGSAPAGGEVRLATPAGEARTARADASGRWTIELQRSPQPQIFGLSVFVGGRRVQAQGYVLIGPRGEAALLRAGAGALRFDRAREPGIVALDFDGQGGALVSGWAQPQTDVSLRLDGVAIDRSARTDAEGRFVFAIPRLAPGRRTIEATGVGFTDALAVQAAPAAPLASGPLRSQLDGQDLRVDWLTPGGGVQTTVLVG